MEHPESLIPPKALVDKWQRDAYRDHGCDTEAYASVLRNAVKWGYAQAMKEVLEMLQTFDDLDEAQTNQTSRDDRRIAEQRTKSPRRDRGHRGNGRMV